MAGLHSNGDFFSPILPETMSLETIQDAGLNGLSPGPGQDTYAAKFRSPCARSVMEGSALNTPPPLWVGDGDGSKSSLPGVVGLTHWVGDGGSSSPGVVGSTHWVEGGGSSSPPGVVCSTHWIGEGGNSSPGVVGSNFWVGDDSNSAPRGVVDSTLWVGDIINSSRPDVVGSTQASPSPPWGNGGGREDAAARAEEDGGDYGKAESSVGGEEREWEGQEERGVLIAARKGTGQGVGEGRGGAGIDGRVGVPAMEAGVGGQAMSGGFGKGGGENKRYQTSGPESRGRQGKTLPAEASGQSRGPATRYYSCQLELLGFSIGRVLR